MSELFHDVGSQHRNQSTDLQANQWTGFYMIGTSVMNELSRVIFNSQAQASI